MENFGNNLKNVRNRLNVSQEQLQKMSGISQAAISKLELGKSSATIYTAQKLADALKVSIYDLIGEPAPPSPPVYDTPLTETERQLISDFRTLNRQGREIILQQMQMVKKIYEQSADVPGMENNGEIASAF